MKGGRKTSEYFCGESGGMLPSSGVAIEAGGQLPPLEVGLFAYFMDLLEILLLWLPLFKTSLPQTEGGGHGPMVNTPV